MQKQDCYLVQLESSVHLVSHDQAPNLERVADFGSYSELPWATTAIRQIEGVSWIGESPQRQEQMSERTPPETSSLVLGELELSTIGERIVKVCRRCSF